MFWRRSEMESFRKIKISRNDDKFRWVVHKSSQRFWTYQSSSFWYPLILCQFTNFSKEIIKILTIKIKIKKMKMKNYELSKCFSAIFMFAKVHIKLILINVFKQYGLNLNIDFIGQFCNYISKLWYLLVDESPQFARLFFLFDYNFFHFLFLLIGDFKSLL